MVLFFFNDTATTEIYTLSLHDALPISRDAMYSLGDQGERGVDRGHRPFPDRRCRSHSRPSCWHAMRSEEHTSELQSQSNLVCRLLLEKKKNTGAYLPCPEYIRRRVSTP